MEQIFGVIEDLLERLNGSDADDKEDAKMSLHSNKDSFVKNLEQLVASGNAKAGDLLNKIKSAKLN
jgi:hypothetical protein